MLSPKSRMGACFAALLPVMFTLAACGGGSSSSHKMNSASGAPKTTQGAGNQITATETEYHIQLSQMTLQPGATTFVAVNKGKVGHSLEINGPGVSNQRIAGTVSPSSSKPLTVTLQAGQLRDLLPDRRSQGTRHGRPHHGRRRRQRRRDDDEQRRGCHHHDERRR